MKWDEESSAFVFSREQTRSIDDCAIQTLKMPGVVLMENAGRGCTDALQAFVGGRVCDKKVVVVASTGNNGGDGFVIARHLTIRGASVTTLVVGDITKLTHDAGVNFRSLQAMRGNIMDIKEKMDTIGEELNGCDVIVDACLGTGIKGALRGTMAKAVSAMNDAKNRNRDVVIVSVDIPTGLDCDEGIVPQGSVCVVADLTVTLCVLKCGFLKPEAKKYLGKVKVADIGIDVRVVGEKLGY